MSLNTAQKAQLTVTDSNGTDLGVNFTYEVSPPGVISAVPADGHLWVSGEAPGTTTLTATGAGSTGSIEIEVTAAPLTLTLGAPVPK